MVAALHSIPTLLGSVFGVLDHLRSQNDVIASWLRLSLFDCCVFFCIVVVVFRVIVVVI